MQIKFNIYFFLVLIIYFITNQIELYVLAMIFVLIHELTHLFFGVLFGFKLDVFRIMPFGFSVGFKIGVQDYNKKIKNSNMVAVKSIIIAIAGPLFNLLIVIYGIISDIDINIIYINLLIFLFNLLPITPLDGEKILINTLKIFYGNRKAKKYVNLINNIAIIILTIGCSILILFVHNISIVIILLILWHMAIKENFKYNTYNKIYQTIDKNYNYL